MRVASWLRRTFSHELTGLMIIGILVRLVLIPYLAWPSDVNAFCYWLTWFFNGINPYTVHAGMYPPFIYFFSLPPFTIARWLGLSPGYYYIAEAANTGAITGMVSANQVNPAFLILWKLPLLCFDILTALLIYRFAKELTNNPKVAKTAFILWFFNPLVLSVSYLHGGIDVIAAFFILLGIFLVYRGHYLSSGLSFGLGILSKLSPVYIAFPLAVIILFRGIWGSTHSHHIKTNALEFSKFAAGVALCLLPFTPMLVDYFRLMYLGVATEIVISGGLNQWFFAANFRGWWWVNSHIGTIQKVSFFYPLICFGVSLALCRFLRWDLGRDKSNILFSAVLFVGLSYIFMPIPINPQYFMWILPLLVLLSMKRSGFTIPLAILSLVGPLFYFAIQAPHAFLFPVAIYTPLCTPEWVSSSILHFMFLPGIIEPFLRQDILLITGGLGFVALLLAIHFSIMNLCRR